MHLTRKQVTLLTIVVCFCNACNFIGIFGGDSESNGSAPSKPAAQVLSVAVSGGFAGVDQHLIVATDGTVTYEDRTLRGDKATVILAVAEIDSLTDLMNANRFFELGDSYITANTADAFLYQVTYTIDDQTKTVRTDDIAAPDNLKRILAGVLRIMEKARDNGLELDLLLSRTQIVKGESVAMTLHVKNKRNTPLVLHFSDGQMFDFIVVQDPLDATAEALVWRWSHDRVFTQALSNLTLTPGEERSFQVTWDGRNNQRDAVTGEFAVQAELVSVPGGTTRRQVITISE